MFTYRDAHSNALAVYQWRPLLAQPGPLHGLISPCEQSCEESYQKERHALLRKSYHGPSVPVCLCKMDGVPQQYACK